LAVFKASVELVADSFGELGDFAEASFHRLFFIRRFRGFTQMRDRGRDFNAETQRRGGAQRRVI
jgi:hypothetical protein